MSLCGLVGAGEELGRGSVGGKGIGREQEIVIYLLYQLESSQCPLTYSYHRHIIWISPLRSKLVSVIAHGSDVQSNFWIKCVGLVHTHHLEVEITVAGTTSYRGVCM